MKKIGVCLLLAIGFVGSSFAASMGEQSSGSAGVIEKTFPRDLVVDIDLYDEIYVRSYLGDGRNLSEKQIEDMVEKFAANGVKTLLLRVCPAGTALYNSKLALYPRVIDQNEIREAWNKYDYLKQGTDGALDDFLKYRTNTIDAINKILAKYNPPKVYIDKAHSLGLKVVIWIDIFDEWLPGFESRVWVKNNPQFQWTARDQKTYYQGIISYAWPESRAYQIAKAQELLALGADGIHLSTSAHTRWFKMAESNDTFGFEKPVVEAYQKKYGKNILECNDWDREAWHEIKGDFMHQFYKEMAQLCHSKGKEFWIGLPLGDYHNMCCSPYWGNRVVARYKQNWKKLVDEKIADVFIIGDYELMSSPTLRYWKAKGLSDKGNLYEWAANTYIPYCKGKTKLYLFGEWLTGERAKNEVLVNKFKDLVLTYGFDGVDIHEGMNFCDIEDLLKPVAEAFK